MINVTNDFKTRTKKIKQQNIKLGIVDGEITVKEVHFMTVKQFNTLPVWMLRKRQEVIAKELKYSFEGNLFKTIMKQIEITVKNAGELKDKNVNFQYGIYVNNDFEFIDLGDYYIKDVEDDKGKTELIVTGYDKMIHFMKTFKQSELQLTYPCTMLTLVQKMCEVCGVELYSTNFFNADLNVDEDYFTAQELTYRDVLEKVAESTLTTIFIKDNKLYLHKLADNPVEKLDSSYLTGLTVKEKFGPVNALVLGRGDVEDNVEAKDDTSIAQNGRCEIRFDENEFVEYQREQVIDEMFEQIKGIQYYAFEGSDVGVMWLEPCDLIEVENAEESTYKTIYLKANITINTGISSDIEAEVPEVTNTEYKVTTKEEKKTLKVERLAKKNEGLIQDLIQETTEQGQKLTEVEQTIDSITQTVSSVETKIETVEDKADNAQNTADSATQKAENAQTSANNAQSTANTANTNAQNAQKTADGAVTQITTTNQKVSQIEQTVSGITQSVSEVEERVETVETKADNAQSSANTANQNVEEVKKQTIYEVDVMYALSSSSTQAPTTGWSTTAPQWENGKYMWQKTVTTYGDGSKTESNATCITGAKGQDGANGTNGTDGEKGDTGIGVKSLVEQYYLSNSNTTQTGGSWKETQDKWTSGKYIWTRNKITWTDNSITYTTPILATGLNNANSVANTANNTANTANSTANTANNTANEAKNTADATNNNLTTNYYTKTETNSQINQKADSITSSVSKTYSTKTETANAKNEAINSANASTDKKLEDYTVTKQLGTVIEQNWEHIKVAWNQISDYIQMMIMDGTASLAILDQSGNIMMSLDKEGQNFYKSGQTTPFGEMGIKKVNNQNYISFSVLGKYGQTIQDGMAWGITIKDDNKFLPILYIKDFAVGNQGSETGSGKLVLNSCDIVLDNMGAGIEANNVKIHGDAMPGIFFTDIDTGKNLMSVTPDIGNVKYATISLLDSISFFKNQAGSNSLKIGNNSGSNYCLFSDDGSAIVKEIFVSSDGSSTNASGQFNFSSLPEYIGDPLVYGVGHKYHLEWAANKLFFYVDVTNVGTLSDKRLKTEIKDIDEDFINAIEEVEMKQFKVANRNGLISFGILAQDLMEIFEKYNKNPFDYEIVYETKYRTDDDTVYYAIDYTQFLVLKQKATDVKLKKLEEENKEKDKLLQDLIARVEKLEGGNK